MKNGATTTHVAETSAFSLSPQQQGLWQQRTGSHPSAFRVQARILIEGELNVGALRACLEGIVERHEIFRTCFLSQPGNPVLQSISAEAAPFFELVIESVPDAAGDLLQSLDETSMSLFDLESGPKLHAFVCAQSGGRHLLTLTLPALCADGITLRNIVRELSERYPDGGSALRAAAEPVQFADAAQWQLDLAQAPGSEAGLEYWQSQLASPPALPRLPFPRVNASALLAPRVHSLTLTSERQLQLDALAACHQCSPREILLTAWAVLLHRISGAEELSLAVAREGRGHPELGDAMGPYARFLPLRTPLDGATRFVDLLRRIQQADREADQWQEYAFLAPDAASWPWAFESIDLSGSWGEDTTRFSFIEHFSCIHSFALKLSWVQLAERSTADFYYDAAQLSLDDVRVVADQFGTLLESILQHPASALRDLNLMSEDARRTIFETFARGPALEVPRECIHWRIEEVAARQPDRTAVRVDDRTLTYRELDQRANRLANRLCKLGVTPGTPVGLCTSRSVEAIVGMLGILKAGGAYVPLDPSYPADRLAFMLEDCGAPVVVRGADQDIRQLRSTAVELVLGESLADSEEPSTGPTRRGTPEDLAYVIYTSGSTGRPKGVPVRHHHLVQSTFARFHVYPGEVQRFLLLSSFAFDSSVAGIFWTLCQGGTLLIAPDPKDPLLLARTIETHRVSHLLSLPSLYEHILEQSADLTSVRTVIVAGETCSPELVTRHRRRIPGAGLYNEYGPTEATVWSTVYHGQSKPSHLSIVPIGRPVPNVEIHVLDENGAPVPVWGVGEIHIGGPGVVDGYLNRGDLTQERFLSNPFGHGKLYRTGDLGRWLSDGNLEYLGRSDQQLKIRGYRIEPGEIESLLQALSPVREAVVAARADIEGDPASVRLVAYLVPREAARFNESEVRAALASRLPAPMVPSRFVVLDRMPRTPNGKLDRNALPALVKPRGGASRSTPASEVEEQISGIWREVLHLDQIGLNDSFFDLGGHSLLGIRIISRMRQIFGTELPMRLLFESPTISGLARNVREFLAEADSNQVPMAPLPPSREAMETALQDLSGEHLDHLLERTPAGAGA